MRKTLAFAHRCALEMIREPISLFFGVIFPLILMGLLTLINNSIPAEANMKLFEIDTLSPGIAAFSLCFLCLFSAMLISKDRTTSFMHRLYVSPMTSGSFIAGYSAPLIPMALAQIAVCFAAALLLGMTPTVRIIPAAISLLPLTVINISLGLICGTVLPEKAVGGICGALLTNVAGWFSGTWFSLDLVGGAFKKIAYFLPYANAVDAARKILSGSGDYGMNLLNNIIWAAALSLISVIVFKLKSRLD